MDVLLLGFQHILNVQGIALIAGGVFLGIIFGAIPGFTATLGVALLLPFTYNLGPYMGLSLLLGIYVGAISGGLISATLLSIPGTPASIVTTFDAYPMAKKGNPQLALSIGIFSSLIGGLFSLMILIMVAPQLANLALAFGPHEYLSLGIFGISVVVCVTSNDLTKGMISAVFGLLIAVYGMDPVVAKSRFTFGSYLLDGGFSILPTLMGFYAINQVLLDITEKQGDISEKKNELFNLSRKLFALPPIKLIKKSWLNFLRSGIIGTFIGILPGAGGSAAGFFAYDQAKKASKTPEKFGEGHYEGIVASETANNSVTGGALIPLMTLGIPGDTVTAILLGGLLIHGLRPGPMLFRDNISVVGTIFAAMFLANILMFFIENVMLRFFSKIINVPKHILMPTILIMCMVGVFSLNNRVFDMWVSLVFGIIGFVFVKVKIPPAPLILGYILEPIIEKNFRIMVMSGEGNLEYFIQRPIAVILLIATLISLIFPFIHKKKKVRMDNDE